MTKLTAPERWALFQARWTATESLPLVIYILVVLGVFLADGASFSSVLLFAVLMGTWWERIGFTRLLTRKDRPEVYRQTVTSRGQSL